MKGFTKAVMRTPHLLTSKVGMSKKSSDPEFDELNRKMTQLEQAMEKLIKDSKAFTEGVILFLTGTENWATHFNNVFNPVTGEYDVIGAHPEAANTIRNISSYQNSTVDLRAAISPELELIESRIINPCKEMQTVMKQIRKNITKRDHKLVDFDRFNNSLTKLREKKEKSLSDEKNLFKLEQDFEQASTDYEYWNNAMKAELPKFMVLCTHFIQPLFHSFYYMQLNIFYLTMEKIQSYASGKYEITEDVAAITATFESQESQSGARDQIDNLQINKRIVSTGRLVQSHRQNSTTPGDSVSSATPTPRTTFNKAPPPPPPGSSAPVAAPPPYTASSFSSTTGSIGSKRPPPPIPANKPKPAAPPVTYVTALYDFEAQAAGDLSFRVGDKIEIVKRTNSAEDWWTGRVNGQEGVFPGNYVQDN